MKWRNVNEKERERGTAWRGEEEWKCVLRDGKREQECARKNRDGGRERRTRNIRKGEKVGGQRRGITEGVSKPE